MGLHSSQHHHHRLLSTVNITTSNFNNTTIMYFFISLIVATFVSFVLAQTPAGFTPQTNNKLEVIFNSTMVNKPGQKMAKTGMHIIVFPKTLSNLFSRRNTAPARTL